MKKLKKLGGEGKMARKKSEAAQRRKTLESLKNALVSNKLSEKFLQDKVDEYMSFYDDLSWINETLIALKSSGNCSIKVYTDATAEKRRISSEMRSFRPVFPEYRILLQLPREYRPGVLSVFYQC